MTVLSKMFEIESSEKYMIYGVHTKPIEETTRCVIMCHGTCSDMNEANHAFVYLSHKLAEAGYAVLRFDFIGSGKSKVDYYYYSLKSAVRDTHDIMDYAQKLGYEDLALLGWSQGGTVAMLSADERVKTVITLAGAVDLSILYDEDMWKGAQRNGFAYYTTWANTKVKFSKEWFDQVLNTDVLQEFSKKKLPTLAFHGLDDEIVDPRWSSEIVDASNHDDSIVIYLDNCDHVFRVFDKEYEFFEIIAKETIEWLNQKI